MRRPKINIFKNKKRLIISAVLVLLIVAAALAFNLFNKDEQTPEPPAEPSYSQLTGMVVDEEVANFPIVGIMVENSEASRPQTGLDSAGIVFEAVTEGGITRYLALYQEDAPEIVGPVRSLRTHFLDWAMGFDVSIAHVGGSAQALELAGRRNAKSMNEFAHSQPYYRDSNRPAPHNMYIRMNDLRKLQEDLGHTKSQFTEIPRESDNPTQNEETKNAKINYSSPTFEVEFRYEASTNSYTRYLAGVPHVDVASNKPITVKNVIVVKTEIRGDSLNAIGRGVAWVFKNGSVTNARWEKSGYAERLRVLDDAGNEIALNRGDSWFSVVSTDVIIN